MNIFKFIISILLIYLLYKVIKLLPRLKSSASESDNSKSSPSGGEDLVEDPVCHTYVPISQALKKEISGRTCYFCSKPCADKYELEQNK